LEQGLSQNLTTSADFDTSLPSSRFTFHKIPASDLVAVRSKCRRDPIEI
jgi:hypothetical protein